MKFVILVISIFALMGCGTLSYLDFGVGSARIKKIGHDANLHSSGTSVSIAYGIAPSFLSALSTNVKLDKSWMGSQTSDITNFSWNLRLEPLSFLSMEAGLHVGSGWIRTPDDDYTENLTGYRLAGQIYIPAPKDTDTKWGFEFSYMRDRATMKRWAGDEDSYNGYWFHMWQIQLVFGSPKMETGELFSR